MVIEGSGRLQGGFTEGGGRFIHEDYVSMSLVREKGIGDFKYNELSV